MNREVKHDNLEDFKKEIKQIGINKVAFAETKEKRAQQIDDNQVGVVRVSKLEILAYKNSIIYKCILSDVDFDVIYNKFITDGFEVKKTSRNIT